MGQLDDDRAQAAEPLRIDPKFTVTRYAQARIYRFPEHAQDNLDALRKVGLPE